MQIALMHLASLLVALAVASLAAGQTQVQVTGGTIEGTTTEDGVRVFKGIPFAAPPVGNLRWKPPQPVVPWEGIREAKKFGPSPEQGRIALLSSGIEYSEDCLHINVWTAAKDATEKLPVLVWIYGGGFSGGSSADPMGQGGFLAKHGVVFVTFNHRVGPLGFLAHPELSRENGGSSGNYGLRDQIAALEWVRDNIAAFGGDPANVTLFGGSSGAISVSMLAASPRAKGLFHRAISESGGAFAPPRTAADQFGQLAPTLEVAEQEGERFLASIDAKDIAAARALPAEAVLKGRSGLPWPNFDGDVLPGDVYELYEAGKFNDIPLLAGTTSDDGALFAAFQTVTPESFADDIRKAMGDYADKFLAAYPHDTPAAALRSKKDLFGDMLFRWSTWTWARMQSEHGQHKAFLYFFDEPQGGAGHGADAPYIFGKPPESGLPFFRSVKAEDADLSRLMVQYWINFAKTGDPNGEGLPQWSPFTVKDSKVMVFDHSPSLEQIPNLQQLQALDVFFAERRGSASNH
jgi:para-nitrobenzyl esterase